MTSATITDQLARIYREARVLVLGDRSPKIDRAFALYREFIAIRASFMELPGDDRSEWEVTLLEKTRRATIVALRHQALAVKDRWVESSAFDGHDQSSPHVNPEHALQLATAAMELHVEDDPDAGRTAQTVDVVRQSLAEAKVSSSSVISPQEASLLERSTISEASRPPATPPSPSPSHVVLHSNGDLIPVYRGGAHQGDTREPEASSEMRQGVGVHSEMVQGRPRAAVSWTQTPWIVLLLIAVGVAFFAIGIGKSGPPIDNTTKESPSGGIVTEVQKPLSTPRSSVVTQLPRSLSIPSAVRNATVLLKSQPDAARVTVEGDFRGTTPLTLVGKPGERLRVVMQKGNWVWRGTLTVDETGKQVVTIRLAPPSTAQPLRPRSTALTSGRVRFDATLRAGIDLYKRGWFGPAAGRFKAAVAIDPGSAEAYLWWGRALMRSDRHAEARQALGKVVAIAQTGPLANEATALLGRLR